MNTNMIRTGIAAAAFLTMPLAAQAADLPQPSYKAPSYVAPVYASWSGFYVGINGGYGFGKSTWEIPAVSPKPKGPLAGATIGYNLQTGTWLWGLEGDIAWSNMKGSEACGAGTCETKNDWFATARGRLGYAGWNNWLPYITGGAAFGNIKANNSAAGSGKATKVGWTVGAGLEYAFLGNWSVKGEYLYADLGSMDCTGCNAAGAPDKITFKTNIVRAGINYRF